ncbi:MAG: hypothetical protein D6690_17260 [Nitrospirae bacterium]|nr:MAG: hypothetical protein D6690_17260 [Nitrospirota bacterium]
MNTSMKWMALIIFGCLCLAYVWIRIDLVLAGYELEKLTKRKAALEREYEGLQMQFSQLTAPQRIAKRAQEQLGLVIPREGQIVVVAVEPPSSDEPAAPFDRIQLAKRPENP